MLLVWVAIGFVYFDRLGASDAYLSIEEVQHARQVESLAASGRSITGQFLPLYFSEPGFPAGRDPLWIYAGAAVIKAAAFSEALVRAPSTVAGLAAVALMYLIAARIFRSRAVGAVAALLLAFTPAHFFQSRIATSQIAPVLCVLVWLLFLARYFDGGRRRDLCVAAAALGVGLYTYLPAVFMMPAFFACTLLALTRAGDGRGQTPARRVDLLAAVATFAVALAPLAWWHLPHSERYAQLLDYYSGHGYNTARPALTTLPGVLSRADLWWNAFNPGLLFFSGDANIRFSTRGVGHFLIPVGVLAGIAVARRFRGFDPRMRVVVTAALLAAPLPAMLAADFEIKRWLTIVPFAILAAACGFHEMRRWPRRWFVPASALLAAIATVQFVAFAKDYHGEYRVRSIPWFGGNIRAAVASVLATASDPRCVLVDTRLYPDYLPLYAGVWGRSGYDEWNGIVDVGDRVFQVPPTCTDAQLIVSHEVVAENPVARAHLTGSHWVREEIPEPGGNVHLLVFRYRRP